MQLHKPHNMYLTLELHEHHNMYDNALSVSHKFLSMQKHSQYVTAYLMSHDTFIHIYIYIYLLIFTVIVF